MKKISIIIFLISVMTRCVFSQETVPTAQIRIASEPSGAKVYYDGKIMDATPVIITNVVPGQHLVVAVKDGYKEFRQTISVLADQRVPLDIKMEPLTGLVLIQSQPSGADINVNSVFKGKAPILITDLPFGKYRVKVSLEGYQSKEIDLNIPDRAPIKMPVDLVSNTGSLELDSVPSEGEVILNGVAKGKTPCNIDKVPAGDNVLEINLQGCESYKQTIKFAAGKTETIKAVLKQIPPELSIVSIPERARIYIDNQFRGEAPLTLKDITPDTAFRVRAEMKGYESVARDVTLSRAEKKIEEFRLEKNAGRLEVITEPAGVTITVDGEKLGQTKAQANEKILKSEPLLIDMISVGERNVVLSCKGYFDKTLKINVEKDKTASVTERLKRNYAPDYRVKTRSTTINGMLVAVNIDGSVKIEVEQGIIKTIPATEIVAHGPIEKKP